MAGRYRLHAFPSFSCPSASDHTRLIMTEDTLMRVAPITGRKYDTCHGPINGIYGRFGKGGAYGQAYGLYFSWFAGGALIGP